MPTSEGVLEPVMVQSSAPPPENLQQYRDQVRRVHLMNAKTVLVKNANHKKYPLKAESLEYWRLGFRFGLEYCLKMLDGLNEIQDAASIR